MSYEPKDEVILFPNERQNDKQPVMRGKVTLTGSTLRDLAKLGTDVELEVKLWGNTSAKGNKFWKGPVKLKADAPRPAAKPEFDDPIPF